MDPAAIERFAVIVPAYNASATIGDCLQAISSSTTKPSEVIVYHDGLTENLSGIARALHVRVISNPGGVVGPARGRNIAARESTCEILIFVDADVIVADDAFRLLLDEIVSDREIWAAFGSYDQTPRVTRRTALYANLRHHWIHQSGEREAVTFWAGLGAVRRDAFWTVGGFNERTTAPEIEDIELGAKLKREGGRIRLVPEAMGKHCKDWTIAQLWRTDIFRRAIPWAMLLADGACDAGHLNTTARDRWSAVLAYLGPLELAGCCLSAWSGVGFAITAVCYVYLNRGLFQLLRRRGVTVLIAGSLLHWIYHLYASAAYIAVKLRLLPRPKDRSRPNTANGFSAAPLATQFVKSEQVDDG
jgi:GT2 family glycosyltransferase